MILAPCAWVQSDQHHNCSKPRALLATQRRIEMKTNIEMQTTLTSYLKRAGILMLALPLLITSGLRAQSTPVINWMKVQSPNLLNINGSGFGTTAGTVLLSGSPVAAVTYWSDTQISVEAGTDQTLSTTVTVMTSTGATAISVASFAATTLGG